MKIRILGGIMSICVTLDAYMTYIGLNAGGEEGNPILRSLIQTCGLVPALVIFVLILNMFILVGIYLYDRYDKLKNLIYYGFLAAIMVRCFIIGGWYAYIIFLAY